MDSIFSIHPVILGMVIVMIAEAGVFAASYWIVQRISSGINRDA